MSLKKEGPLVGWYENRIGTSSTEDEARGYWVFVAGVMAGVIGISLVLISDIESTSRGAGAMISALALLLLVVGPIIRLPLKRSATLLSYLGAVFCLLAIAWFFQAYPDNFGADFEGQEVEIIGMYGLGLLIIAIGGIITPLLTSPREKQKAAEMQAAQAEGERVKAQKEAQKADTKRQAAEQRTQEVESERDATEKRAEQLARDAAHERAEREALEQELAEIANSQSQFELYTDSGGKYRWRLRHRNHNIIADSAQGYSSRQKAQQGLSAVKRDAFGGAVVDLDKSTADVEAVDDAVEGHDAPEFVEDVESQATIEVYEDAGGRHRWRLRHENGNIIGDSGQGYSSSNGRDNAVERMRHYVQSADYLHIDPAAFELYRDTAGKYRWRLLHENGTIMADSGQGYSSRQKARQGIDSVQANAGEKGSAEFEVYEDNAGEYRWRLRHRNGNIIADSGDGYTSKASAEDAVERVTAYVPDAFVLDIGTAAFEIYEDNEGKWRWRLRHRNGNIMADSGQGYADRSGAEEGIHSVKRDGPNATVEAVEE